MPESSDLREIAARALATRYKKTLSDRPLAIQAEVDGTWLAWRGNVDIVLASLAEPIGALIEAGDLKAWRTVTDAAAADEARRQAEVEAGKWGPGDRRRR